MQHIDPEKLKNDIAALGKLSLDDLKKGRKAERRKSFIDHLAGSIAEFLGVTPEDAVGEKVGRKISKARLEKLEKATTAMRDAAVVLQEVLTEAADDGADKGRNEDMKPEDVKAAVTEALKPVATELAAVKTRLDTVEADVKKNAPPDKKGDDDKKPEVKEAEALKGIVTEALKPIQEALADVKKRVEGVEALATKSRQPDADDTKDKKDEKDPFGSAVRDRRPSLISTVQERAAARKS